MAGTGQAAAPPHMASKEVSLKQAMENKQERKERSKKNKYLGGIPSDMAPRWEVIVEESAKRIKAKRDTIKIAIGERPYRGIPTTEAEAETRYLQMRESAKLQTQSLEENVTRSVDGRLLINKEYLNAIRSLEKKIREGEIQTELGGGNS
jgi:hypothetical protein